KIFPRPFPDGANQQFPDDEFLESFQIRIQRRRKIVAQPSPKASAHGGANGSIRRGVSPSGWRRVRGNRAPSCAPCPAKRATASPSGPRETHHSRTIRTDLKAKSKRLIQVLHKLFITCS